MKIVPGSAWFKWEDKPPFLSIYKQLIIVPNLMYVIMNIKSSLHGFNINYNFLEYN